MSMNMTEQVVGYLTIQQVSRRSGLSESALRYYESIGLIDKVPRDERSGHRRYPSDLVAAIEAMSCLRGTGMSVADMRAYLANMRGQPDSSHRITDIRSRQIVSRANVPKSVPKRHENGPQRDLRGPFLLVAGTGFEPATSGL
jgi:DNA-binding transcriptional MerR regulator